MKNKLHSLKAYYQSHPKRFWIIGGVFILVLLFFVMRKPATTTTLIPVTRTDLKQTILATGQVTSQTDLNLSFSASGLIATLPVSVGDKVWKGQVLATLDNGNQYAALMQAQAGLKSAQASYQKVVDGASSQEVAVAQAALASAQTDLSNTQSVQDTLVQNAHRSLLNADLSPTLTAGNSSSSPTITGTYTGVAEGSYIVTLYSTGTGGYFSYSGLEDGNGIISTTMPTALGTKGLLIQFPSNFSDNSGASWTIKLPNTGTANYLTQYNAYQNALKNHDSAISAAQAVVNQRQADLDLKKAAARPVDLDVAEAQVLTAQAQVASAEATYGNTIIKAPANGTVVHVDTKIGERVDAQKEVLVLQDVGNLYVQANINETSIAKVALDQPVSMTLDAFGPDVILTGNVIHIDPSSTTSDGVVNYIIKTSVTDPSGKYKILPGMNANMTITAWDHPAVIAVPKVAIKTGSDGISTVEIATDDKSGKFTTQKITTGLTGDGNLVEVSSGLTEGQNIVVTSK